MKLPANLVIKDINPIIHILLVIFVAVVARIVAQRFLLAVFGTVKGRLKSEKAIGRTKTARSLILSLFDALIIIIAGMMVLSEIGVDIGPILTGAGLLGLAISLGSQTLIKDVISGFFIIMENQFNVGDVIEVNGYKGKVKRMSLRSTILEDESGNLIFMPNSQIVAVKRIK